MGSALKYKDFIAWTALFCLSSVSVVLFQNIDSQRIKFRHNYDSLYIESYPDLITTRLYLSQKSTNLSLEDSQEPSSLDYMPNTTLNLGIGATAKYVTVNLAYGFKLLSPKKGQGKTRYLDLQSHRYTRKFVIDFFG